MFSTARHLLKPREGKLPREGSAEEGFFLMLGNEGTGEWLHLNDQHQAALTSNPGIRHLVDAVATLRRAGALLLFLFSLVE
jgi:hypothetical protein